MIKGMTGFGSAQISVGKIKGVVEVKSVNHRYFDVSYYLPIGFSSTEDKIRQLLQKEVKRGRLTVSLKITQKPSTLVSMNKDVVEQYLKYGHELKKELSLKNDLTLSDLVRLPGVMEIKETLVDPDDLWPTIDVGMKKAIAALTNMRIREGKSLAADVGYQLKEMMSLLTKIKARAAAILKTKKKELGAEEFSSCQKSMDINEEIARLTHYIEDMKAVLKVSGEAGKNMDFIAQEMQRETNTIGSKLQDKFVSNSVIAIKGKIEKIREQAQNIE